MDELRYESHASWHNLQAVWDEVQTEWHDQQSIIFAEHFWHDFADDMAAYLRLMNELFETLDQAHHVAWDL